MSQEIAGAGRNRRIDRLIVAIEALVGIGVIVAVVGKSYGIPSTIVFALCGIAVAATGYFLVRMVGSLNDDALDVPGRVLDEERIRLEHEKLLLLQGIKEFEADAATGKVDRADYEHLRQSAEARALDIIRTLKDSDQRWRREAERLVASRLGAQALAPIPAAAAPSAPASSAEPAATEAPAPAPIANGAPQATAILAVFDTRPVRFAAIAERSDLRCEGCGQENDADARYCIGCGRPRAPEGAA